MFNYKPFLLSLLTIFLPVNAFSEIWVLLEKDFACLNERGKSCYIGLLSEEENETFLSEIIIERHAFREFKLSLFVDYLNSDEYEIFINEQKYNFKNNYPRGFLSKYIEEIITDTNIADGYYEQNHPFNYDTFKRITIETSRKKYMIKIWNNLERLEFYLYYKDEKLAYNIKI